MESEKLRENEEKKNERRKAKIFTYPLRVPHIKRVGAIICVLARRELKEKEWNWWH